MEIKYPRHHIPITASLFVHAMLAWAIAHQAFLPDIQPDPEPKMKVHVVSKPPPPPANSKAQPSKPVVPVQKRPVTPVPPVKQVKPPVQSKVPVRDQSRRMTAKMSPVQVPKNIQPVRQAPGQNDVQQKPASATPIRHTAINPNFKAPVTLPVRNTFKSLVPVTSPVTTKRVISKKAIQPISSIHSNSFSEKTTTYMQSAHLDSSLNKAVEPVKRVSVEPQNAAPGPDVQLALDQFNNAIWGKILQAKYYPKMARLRRLEGQPVVKFTIKKDGSLSQIMINNSSSHEILDSAALKTIQNAAPFPEIPEILQEEQMILEIPISFILNK